MLLQTAAVKASLNLVFILRGKGQWWLPRQASRRRSTETQLTEYTETLACPFRSLATLTPPTLMMWRECIILRGYQNLQGFISIVLASLGPEPGNTKSEKVRKALWLPGIYNLSTTIVRGLFGSVSLQEKVQILSTLGTSRESPTDLPHVTAPFTSSTFQNLLKPCIWCALSQAGSSHCTKEPPQLSRLPQSISYPLQIAGRTILRWPVPLCPAAFLT